MKGKDERKMSDDTVVSFDKGTGQKQAGYQEELRMDIEIEGGTQVRQC